MTIDGTGAALPDDLAGLFEIANRSYIKVSGLRITHAGPHANDAGILVNNSQQIVIQENYTNNTASSGIGVWNSSGITVDGNEVAPCRRSHRYQHASTNVELRADG